MGLIVKLTKKLVKRMQEILGKNLCIKKCSMILISLMQISWSNMTDGEAALANFTKKFNQEISKEYGLYLFGSGAAFPVKIEEIILSFQSDYCQDVVGARKLAVEITHKMIDRMNQDKNLLKYLSNNPASIKNVNLTISFKEQNSATSSTPLQSVMVIGTRNKVVYNTENEDRSMLDTFLRETFDEAERILQQESSPS